MNLQVILVEMIILMLNLHYLNILIQDGNQNRIVLYQNVIEISMINRIVILHQHLVIDIIHLLIEVIVHLEYYVRFYNCVILIIIIVQQILQFVLLILVVLPKQFVSHYYLQISVCHLIIYLIQKVNFY